MAKRRLLQWMRDQLNAHAGKVVLPAKQKKALDAAYAKAAPLVMAVVAKAYPASDMRVLAKYGCAQQQREVKLSFPNGIVTQFKFDTEADSPCPYIPDEYEARKRIFLADAATATAVDKWEDAHKAYTEERKKRLAAYTALIAGAVFVEDIVEVWPEAKDILPAGSPPIALGPEQIALVKADQKERKAA